MNTHNPANDHWPKARPLRHRSVAMRSRWNVPRSYLMIFMVNFPLATIMLYHVTSLFLIVYPSICPISSFDSYFHIKWWFIPRYPIVSPYFPMFFPIFDGQKMSFWWWFIPIFSPVMDFSPPWKHQLWPQAILRWHQTAHWNSARLRRFADQKWWGTTKILY